MSVEQRLLSSLAWIQSHGVGTSQCVIIRSAIQTAHQLNQLIFREVTSALCLCLFKDKRKEAPGLLMFPRFHLTGEEQGRSVAHQPWITSNKARPFWQCGSSSASEQERPLWPLRTATWERVLTVAKHFIWKKVASAIICLTFNRKMFPLYISEWHFPLQQCFPPYSHFPFKRSW